MADDQDKSQKTEDPTQRKLDDAHEKGQVVKSQEVSNLAMIAASTLVLAVFAAPLMSGLVHTLIVFLEQPHRISVDAVNMGHLVRDISVKVSFLLLGPVIVLILGALASNLIQHKPVLTLEKVKPKIDKINPISGFKQKFSLRVLVEFAKNLAKVAVVGAAVMLVVWPDRDILGQLMTVPLPGVLDEIYSIALRMLLTVIVVMTVIAAADYAYQWWEHQKNLRMSVQDIRDEHKDTEGDPMIKARIRQLRQERARQRMMAAVPEATVVVTNPTHFAVALKYEHDELDAPVVVAKGQDILAQRIRAVAEENKVPIVENPPLARALYASAEIGEEVPVAHYKAVAEVIGFVFRLRRHPALGRRPA